MKTSHVFLTITLTMILLGLACSVNIQLTDEPSPPVQPQAPAPDQPGGAAPAEPTTAPPATLPATITATPTTESNLLMPSGFLVMVNDSSVAAYSLTGQPISSLQTPGISLGNANNVHVAGGVSAGTVSGAVLYLSFDNAGMIYQNLHGEISTSIAGPDVSYLCGAPGQAAFAYTTTTWDSDALVSHLYVRGAQGGGASWALERVDPESYTVLPLAVQAQDGQPQGVWYSLMPWGIGGDIVFPPRKSLTYLDLAAGGTEQQHLSADLNPVGMSPDMTWVAYMPANFGFVEENAANLVIYNLLSASQINIPLKPTSNRGAGYAAFSPDNHYVAWMEGSGWLMAETPDFHSKVIIADLNGNITAELDDNVVAAVTGTPNANWVQPVGWLDGQTLLIQVRGENWSDVSLVKIGFDGSGIAYLAAGSFAGLIYP
jgi:hypothetical protein